MRVKLGIAPINWSNDDLPELGGDISLETCLSQMREAGFAGTEIGHKFPSEGAAIRDVLERHRLQLASAWHSTFFLSASLQEELARLSQRLKVLTEAGARRINLCECTGTIHGDISRSLTNRPRLSRDDWPILCHGLSEAAKVCDDAGFKVAYHHHMGTVVQSEDEILTLLDKTDSAVGLCFDSGHLRFAGANPVSVWPHVSSRVTHVHLKDVRLLALYEMRERSFLDCVKAGAFTVPGDGDIDFTNLISKIDASGYEGWMIVEAEQIRPRRIRFFTPKKLRFTLMRL